MSPPAASPPDTDYLPDAQGPDMGPRIVLIMGGVFLLIVGGFLLFAMNRCSAWVSGPLQDIDFEKLRTDRTWREDYENLKPLNADALLKALRRDAAATRRTYEGKPLVLRGTYDELHLDENTPPTIVLASSEGEVLCQFTERHLKELRALSPGARIVVGGVVDWMNRKTVKLRDCHLQAEWLAPRR